MLQLFFPKTNILSGCRLFFVHLSDMWLNRFLFFFADPLKWVAFPLLASAAGRSLHRPLNSRLLANNGNYHNLSRETRRFWPGPPPHSPVSEARHWDRGEVCVARCTVQPRLWVFCVYVRLAVCALKMKHKKHLVGVPDCEPEKAAWNSARHRDLIGGATTSCYVEISFHGVCVWERETQCVSLHVSSVCVCAGGIELRNWWMCF